MESTDELFMAQALRLAITAQRQDEVPIGAVVVKDKRVIAKGYNQVEKLSDPTAHAEMLAITSAAAALKSKWLQKCTLYVTIEPCMMCAGALVLARVKRVVFGAFDPKSGAFGSKITISALGLNHAIKVTTGILESECAALISDFFRSKRKKYSAAE